MAAWSFWDWVAYSGLWVAVVMTAIEETKKRWPRTLKVLPTIKGWFAFVPLGLVTLATVIFIVRWVWTPSLSSADLQPVIGQKFENQIVAVDGKDFSDCTFRNVTFRFAGGEYNFERATFEGNIGIETENDTIQRGINLFVWLDARTVDHALSRGWKRLPPQHFK